MLNWLRSRKPEQNDRLLEQAIPEYLFYTPDRIDRFRRLNAWRADNYKNEWDSIRVHLLIRLIEQVSAIPSGDYIEMGTQYGGTAKIIFDQMRPDRHLYCFDTFHGFTREDLDAESKIFAHGFTTESITPMPWTEVRDIITGGQQTDRLTLVPGHVPDSLESYPHLTFRFAHLDMDLYEPTRGALEWLWPRMERTGIIFLHDYDCLPGVKKAVDDFSAKVGQSSLPVGDRFGSVLIAKPG